MAKKKIPKRLWDYGIIWISETGNLAVSSSRYADGRTSIEIITINQHKYAQVITHKCGFSAVYPINNMTGDSIGQSLIDFIHDFGIPRHLTFDGHKS